MGNAFLSIKRRFSSTNYIACVGMEPKKMTIFSKNHYVRELQIDYLSVYLALLEGGVLLLLPSGGA